MVRDLRYVVGAPYWETLLVFDRVNRASFELQERLKEGLPPQEVFAAWMEIRDLVDRHLRILSKEEAVLRSPSERALANLQAGLEKILGWDLSPYQRDRIEGLLRQAEREHLGSEAAAA